ncbi:MAG: phosphoribosylglycinamide formyltransferase [Negativicutes bacterium]
MRKTVLGVLVSGRGSNLQAIIDAISADRLDAKIGLVISDNPDAHALQRVAGWNIPTVVVDRKKYSSRQDFEERLAAEFALHHVDLILLAGFMRILSSHFISRFPGKIMNIHPALLPAFPGLNAQKQALDYGAKVAGCTVHFVDEGMDSGPIILQEAVPVLDNDTVETLSERILHVEHILYPRAVNLYCQQRLAVEGRRVRILPKMPKEGAKTQ